MMLTTTDSRRDTTAAVWVAGTGAFLLVAAAAVFVAYRWDQLPDGAKLGVVGALTGAFLLGGRALRRRLPATGDVLFHLGAFLLPIDLAGLCVRTGLDWRETLLAQGLLGTVVLGGLAIGTRSVVLGWAGAAAMLLLAAGVAALTPVTAPLALAAAAVAATAAGLRRPAVGWAAAAGLAPVGALLAHHAAGLVARGTGQGTLVELGLAGRGAAYAAVGSGLAAAVVLGRWARARNDLLLAGLAVISVVAGAGSAWAAANPSDQVDALGAAAAFLGVQVAAAAAARDPFWRGLAGRTATAVEAVASVPAGLLAAVVVAAAVVAEDGFDFLSDAPAWEPAPALAVAFALAGLAWLAGSWRRTGPTPSLASAAASVARDPLMAPLASSCFVAAVAVGTASTYAVAAALLAAAVWHAVSGRAPAVVAGAAAAAWAPVAVSLAHPAAAAPVALAAAATLVLAAWVSARSATAVRLLAGASLVPLAVGAAVLAGTGDVGGGAAGAAAVVVLWLLALAFDRRDQGAGHVVRGALAVPVVIALGMAPADALVVLGLVVVLVAVDAVRLDQPRLAVGSAVVLPVVLFDAARLAGLADERAGVLLCIAASAPAGLALLVDRRWREPGLAAAAALASVGLAMASADAAATADALVALGALGVVAGVALRNLVVGHVGAAAASVGIAVRVADAGVTAAEAYLALPCLQLVVLGWALRRETRDGSGGAAGVPSSWVAYAPAVGLLGGAGLAERLGGGPAWHALVAGGVGVAAVAAGGWRRLAGPLFVGTALLVAVTLLESLHRLAGVPTWGWLALGGSALLATGVALERSATSPLEAGRRLVDVIAERFE